MHVYNTRTHFVTSYICVCMCIYKTHTDSSNSSPVLQRLFSLSLLLVLLHQWETCLLPPQCIHPIAQSLISWPAGLASALFHRLPHTGTTTDHLRADPALCSSSVLLWAVPLTLLQCSPYMGLWSELAQVGWLLDWMNGQRKEGGREGRKNVKSVF